MPLGTAPHILNIAHRGARAFAPENTLAAFTKAKTFGCDMFEMDVHLSKDGEIIVYHDDHLLRCTDAKARFPGRNNYDLSDFTYQEISQLDAGSWYVEQLNLPAVERQAFLHSLTEAEMIEYISPSDQNYYASGAIKILTLAETLHLAKDLDLMVNIELKSHSETDVLLVAGVVRTVNELKLHDKVIISSFNHTLLKLVRKQTNTIATAVLIDDPIKAPITYLRKVKANAYNVGCYKGFKTNNLNDLSATRFLAHLNKIRKAGFGVNVWTCNDEEEMGFLFSAGITGLISDYPNRVRDKLVDYFYNT